MSFWGELRRRNVVKVAAAYLIASWLIVQVVGVLTEPLGLPDALDTVVVVLLAIGFPFALVIAWVYEVTPEGIKITAEPDAGRDVRIASGQRLTYVVIGLLVIAVGLMALDTYVLTPSPTETREVRRIAILPCTDLSPDPTNSYFADGFHAELIQRLASLSGLDVISQTSVLRYANGRTPITQVAEELDVPAVMECFARYAGDQVRLMIQLIDGETDVDLWSDSFRADMSELGSLFDTQAEIAMNVANALSVEFFDDEIEQIERLPTQSREAYELYLASFAVFRGDNSPGWEAALELVDQALQIDPGFAEAWAQRARILVQGSITAPARSLELQELAEQAARQAITINPNLVDAYVMLGYALSQRLDWIGAERAFQQALQINPGLREIAPYSLVLLATGKFEQARQILENARTIRPSGAAEFSVLIHANHFLGDIDRAIDQYEVLRQTFANPQIVDTAMRDIYVASGELDRARNIPPPTDPVELAALGHLEAPDTARPELKRIFETDETLNPVSKMRLAVWAAHFGDNSLAIDALRESKQESALGAYLIWLPQFDDLRTTPQFRDFLRDFGFVDYWREYGWPEYCRPVSSNDFECR